MVPVDVMVLAAVTAPALVTENLEAPPVCRSKSLDAAALAVSVMLTTRGLKVVAALFQIWLIRSDGLAVPITGVANCNVLVPEFQFI
jgi:hypothetical protein